MDKAQIEKALVRDRTIDITTIGRKSRLPRRIEIWFYNLDGRLYITGLPGTRDWLANIKANPEFTFHLKGSVQADIPAHARPILDPAERRRVMTRLLPILGRSRDLDSWLEASPLVEVSLDVR